MTTTALPYYSTGLRRSILLAILITFFAGYPLANVVLGSRTAIEIGNSMLLSFGCGIVIAYAPVAADIFRYAVLSRSSVLSIGIFASWLAIVYRTSASMIWRLLDQPVDWLNSGWWGFHIAISCFAAACHLIAPGAVEGHIPARQWVKIGAIVSAGVFFFTGLIVLRNL